MLGVKEVYIARDKSENIMALKINARIKEGWELYGKLIVAEGPEFVQMMVKLKDPDASGNRNKK